MSLSGSNAVFAARDVEVSIWPADFEPDVIVVQVDTGALTKRLRINLNDGPPVWVGDPELDSIHTAQAFSSFDLDAALTILDDIPATVAEHVMYVMGAGGYQPGSFTSCLIEAILKSDAHNFTKMSREWPEYCAAIVIARMHPTGIELMRQRAS